MLEDTLKKWKRGVAIGAAGLLLFTMGLGMAGCPGPTDTDNPNNIDQPDNPAISNIVLDLAVPSSTGIGIVTVEALDAAGKQIAFARVPVLKKYPDDFKQQYAWSERLRITRFGLAALLSTDQHMVENKGLNLFTDEAGASGLQGLFNDRSAYNAVNIYQYGTNVLRWTEAYYDEHLEEATEQYMANQLVRNTTWNTIYPRIYDFILDNLDSIFEYYDANKQDVDIRGLAAQFFDAMAASAFNGSGDLTATNDATAADKALVKKIVNKYMEFYSEKARLDSVALTTPAPAGWEDIFSNYDAYLAAGERLRGKARSG